MSYLKCLHRLKYSPMKFFIHSLVISTLSVIKRDYFYLGIAESNILCAIFMSLKIKAMNVIMLYAGNIWEICLSITFSEGVRLLGTTCLSFYLAYVLDHLKREALWMHNNWHIDVNSYISTTSSFERGFCCSFVILIMTKPSILRTALETIS